MRKLVLFLFCLSLVGFTSGAQAAAVKGSIAVTLSEESPEEEKCPCGEDEEGCLPCPDDEEDAGDEG